MRTCTLVTCQPYANSLVTDDILLTRELQRRGIRVDRVSWEDTDYSWSTVDCAIVRSAWNTHLKPDAYRAWLKATAEQTVLLNPERVISWNLDKSRYFRDLSLLGVLIPTQVLSAGQPVVIKDLIKTTGWGDVVIKPATSANSYETLRITGNTPESLQRGQDHLNRLLPKQKMLVQPYLESIESEGEHSHVFVGGKWSHAFLKLPFSPRLPGEDLPEQEVHPVFEELQIALLIARFVEYLFGGDALPYLRIDLVRDGEGVWRLMEIEANEPVLHLEMGEACAWLADIIIRAISKHSSTLSLPMPPSPTARQTTQKRSCHTCV